MFVMMDFRHGIWMDIDIFEHRIEIQLTSTGERSVRTPHTDKLVILPLTSIIAIEKMADMTMERYVDNGDDTGEMKPMVLYAIMCNNTTHQGFGDPQQRDQVCDYIMNKLKW